MVETKKTTEQKWYQQKAREAKADEAVSLIQAAALRLVESGDIVTEVEALGLYLQLLQGSQSTIAWAALEAFRVPFSPESREMALERLASLIGVKVAGLKADAEGIDPFEGLT